MTIKKVLLNITLLVALSLAVNVSHAHAGSLYLSPAKQTIGQGSTFNVNVRMSSGGDAINAVQVNLNYPADKLDFIRINSSGSSFGIDAPSSGGGGGVSISRGNIAGVAGDKFVAAVTFKAKQNSGTATIGFSGGSALVRSSDQANVYGGGAGSTITFATVTPKGTSTTATNSTDKTAPVISSINVDKPDYNIVKITWKTDEKSTSEVQYGLTEKYGVVATSDGSTLDHSVTIDSKLLVPGLHYHYKVVSKDSAGNESSSSDKTFIAKGYIVKLILKNKNGQPLINTPVVLNSEPVTGRTNDKGEAIFIDVESGKHLVQVEDKDSKKAISSTTIEVKEMPNQVQDFSVPVDRQFTFSDVFPKIDWFMILAGISGVVLIIIGVVGFRLFKKRSIESV